MIRQQKCFKEKWNNVWCGNQRCFIALQFTMQMEAVCGIRKNYRTGIKTIHYGEKKLVQPDKARYVYEISRYIEYVENGNMKSGVLLLEYYTDSIDEVLLHYKSQKSAYCYLLDTNRRLLYHPFEKEIASEMYQEKTVKEAMACKNYKIEEQSGGKWLIERQQIGYTGWNVVLVNSIR